jgi:hypothetical protein
LCRLESAVEFAAKTVCIFDAAGQVFAILENRPAGPKGMMS